MTRFFFAAIIPQIRFVFFFFLLLIFSGTLNTTNVCHVQSNPQIDKAIPENPVVKYGVMSIVSGTVCIYRYMYIYIYIYVKCVFSTYHLHLQIDQGWFQDDVYGKLEQIVPF